MSGFIKSHIIYMGNKRRLLKDISQNIPNDIKMFVDCFGGSGVMSYNFGDKAIYNEFNPNVFNYVKILKENTKECKAMLPKILKDFDLSTHEKLHATDEAHKKCKEGFERLKKHVAQLEPYTIEWASCCFVLQTNAIFNSITFKEGTTNPNMSCGEIKNVKTFSMKLQEIDKDVKFMNGDWSVALEFALKNYKKEDLFIYVDPPYCNTKATYNKKTGTGAWTLENEKVLIDKLIELDKQGYRWAMSNTLIGKEGEINQQLIDFSKKFVSHEYKISYSIMGSVNDHNTEVLITNEFLGQISLF